MLMYNFLQKRKSVRDFKDKLVNKRELDSIKKIIENVAKETENIKFHLYENGNEVYNIFNGKAGYDGVMIKAPCYISVINNRDDDISLIDLGYYLEKVDVEISDLDLGTCIITVDQFSKNEYKDFLGENANNIKYLLAFGYPVRKKLFSEDTEVDRFPLKDIVFLNELNNPISIDMLEERGLLDLFSSIRYAPSYLNSQPWIFVIKESEIIIYMKKNQYFKENLVDMGIIILFLQKMLESIGIYSNWIKVYENFENYIEIGKFKI